MPDRKQPVEQQGLLEEMTGGRPPSGDGRRPGCGHRPHHAEPRRATQRLRPGDARRDGSPPRRLREDDDIKVVLLRGAGRRVHHRRRHGQRVQLVRQRHRTRRRQGPATEPASPPRRRPPDVRLLPRVPGLPEGRPSPRSAATRWAAGSSWRSWPTSPSWRATPASACRPRGSSARRSDPSTCSSTAWGRPWPAGCCSPATRSGPASSRTSASSPRSLDDAEVEARGRLVGPQDRQDARRRHRDRQGGVPPRRAAAGVPGRGGRQLHDPRLRHQPAVRRRTSSTS